MAFIYFSYVKPAIYTRITNLKFTLENSQLVSLNKRKVIAASTIVIFPIIQFIAK